MGRYAAKRLLGTVPLLLAVSFLSFALMRLSGSDAVQEKQDRAGTPVSQEVLDAARAELGLDRPFLAQYVRWLGNLLRGDMGTSYVSGRAVLPAILSKLPATLLLAALSAALTVAVSLPLGVLAAARQNRLSDWLIRLCSFAGNSMPGFFTALLLLDAFSLRLRLFPVISQGVGLRSAFLPALTLSVAMSAKYLRQVRAAVLEELKKPYVAGDRARGVPFPVTLFGGVLRSVSATLLTLFSLSLGSLLGGTAIVESIFLWDGVGRLAVEAIRMRDYPVVQAYVLWMAAAYTLINLLADLTCRLLDPRIRLGGEEE